MFLTILFLLVLIIAFFYKVKFNKTKDDFFDKNYTTVLKGLCSIIVIFVHIPLSYQNPLQDAVGSFGFIAVTCFFMISSFGMQYSLDRNPHYLKHFPLNRLSSLVTPNILINIICWGTYFIIITNLHLNIFVENKIGNILRLNNYVIILLEYCLLFYICSLLSNKYKWKPMVKDSILITWVLGSSLYLYFTRAGSVEFSAQMGWCYERMGLIWGIILYRNFEKIKRLISKYFTYNFIIFLIISLCLGVAYLKFKETWFWGQYLLKIIMGVAIIIFYFLATFKITLFNKITNFLGKISYETYLSHGFIANLIIIFFPGVGSGIFTVCTICITLLFSFLINSIDRPMIKAIKQFFTFRSAQRI